MMEIVPGMTMYGFLIVITYTRTVYFDDLISLLPP